MGGGHGGGTTFKGITVHQPKSWHSVTGKGLCAVMWFWVLYRAKQAVLLYWVGDTLGRATVIMDMSTRLFKKGEKGALVGVDYECHLLLHLNCLIRRL